MDFVRSPRLSIGKQKRRGLDQIRGHLIQTPKNRLDAEKNTQQSSRRKANSRNGLFTPRNTDVHNDDNSASGFSDSEFNPHNTRRCETKHEVNEQEDIDEPDNGPRMFDGVNLDEVTNPKAAAYVDNAVRNVSLTHKNQQRILYSQRRRGANHQKGSLLSLESTPKKNQQHRIQNGRKKESQLMQSKLHLGKNHHMDYLDQAQAEQDMKAKEKRANITKSMGANMDRISSMKLGGGNMISNRRKNSEKKYGSSLRANHMSHIESKSRTVLSTSAEYTSKKESREEGGAKEKKRKAAMHSDNEDACRSPKKLSTPDNGRTSPIQLDQSADMEVTSVHSSGNTVHDESDSVSFSPFTSTPQHKKYCSNDDGEDLTAAINSIQHLSPDEYQKTSKSDTPLDRWNQENVRKGFSSTESLNLRKAENGKGNNGKKKKGKSVDIRKLLPKKNADEVEDFDSDDNIDFGVFKSEDKPVSMSQRTKAQFTRDRLRSQGMVPANDGYQKERRSYIGSERKDSRNNSGSSVQTSSRTRSQRRKSKDNKPKPGGNEENAIMIDSSSDEDDDDATVDLPDPTKEGDIIDKMIEGDSECPRRRTRAVGDRECIDAVRIAIGSKVIRSRCELEFQFGTKNPYVQISYRGEDGKKKIHNINVENELKELRYSIASDDENGERSFSSDDYEDAITFISFRAIPNKYNKLNEYADFYDQGNFEPLGESKEKWYITVEVRDADDLLRLTNKMHGHSDLQTFLESGAEVERYNVPNFVTALVKDSREDRDRRLGVAGRTRSGGRKIKNIDDRLLFVFPFDAEESVLKKASDGLKELGGDCMGVGQESSHKVEIIDSSSDGDEAELKSYTRTHYISISQADKDRLDPGEFLNDSLVDFWMRWISRGESQSSKPKVHFFTSHFMTTLVEDGPEAVASWTAKKKINIFEKKLIFVPINKNLHWSLCVIVCPGLVVAADNFEGSDADLWNQEGPCLLFLDSLKMHSRYSVAKNIMKWINFEWNRHKKTKESPFTKTTIPLICPKIPYQDNSCDCGVFVCRYAYSLYILRHQFFTFADIEEGFKDMITKSDAFDFGMSDIARIRKEMKTLIDRLAREYARVKEDEKAKKRAERLAKLSKSESQISDSTANATSTTSLEGGAMITDNAHADGCNSEESSKLDSMEIDSQQCNNDLPEDLMASPPPSEDKVIVQIKESLGNGGKEREPSELDFMEICDEKKNNSQECNSDLQEDLVSTTTSSKDEEIVQEKDSLENGGKKQESPGLDLMKLSDEKEHHSQESSFHSSEELLTPYMPSFKNNSIAQDQEHLEDCRKNPESLLGSSELGNEEENSSQEQLNDVSLPEESQGKFVVTTL